MEHSQALKALRHLGAREALYLADFLRNPIRSVIPYSTTLFLEIIGCNGTPGDSRRFEIQCFSGTSYFCLTGPLRLNVATVCLNTATRGLDDLV